MKLSRLVVARLPGIEGRLELAPARDRVSVVIGPNASGKTSLIRALSILLQRRPDAQPVDITAEFSDAAHTIKGNAIGQARTWLVDGVEAERPPWPDADGLAAYLIRAEELEGAGATEQQFSDTLRQVMAGGYDLDALARATPFEKPARPQKLAREHEQAVSRLQALEARHAALAGEIDQLESLREQRRESIEAQRRLQAQQRALELLGLEHRLAAIHKSLAQFPDDMDRLDGGEAERLQRLDDELVQRRQRREQARRKRTEASRSLADSGIREIGALEAFATDLGEQRQQLQAHERELADLQQQRRDLERARETAARRAGHVDPGAENTLTREALDGLEKLAERVRGTRAEVDALEREAGWRGRYQPDPDELADLDAGIAALRNWLACPPTGWVSWTGWGVMFAAASGTAGWAWLELGRPFIAAIAAVAALMPLSHLAVLTGRSWRMAQQRKRFEAGALEAPAQWQRTEVTLRLRKLEARRAEGLRDRSEAERTEELDAELERARASLTSEQRQLEMAADRLQVRTADLLDARGRLKLNAVIELNDVSDRLERLRAASSDREGRRGMLVDRIRNAFTTASRPAPAPLDADGLGSLLNRLNRDIMQARSDREAVQTADDRLAELEDEIESLSAERRALFEVARLADDDRDGLRDRLRKLDQWRRLRDELRGLEHGRRAALEALGNDPDLLEMARSRDEAALVQLGERLTTSARLRDELAERIATIENERKSALAQRELERLNAERERLRGELESVMEAHRDAEAAQLLIERARAGYSQAHQPTLFTRARKLFGRMTRTRFELTFDDGRFSAFDQSMGEQRSIGELSTATRIQLLLALRLAWIEETESEGPGLPVFLDEVLATTDPERYRAVVEAVQEVVAAGRQVIYLSSQPADAQAWQRFAGQPTPEIIELAPVAETSFGFELPASPPCPDATLNPDDWAIQAGVVALDPWRGPESIPLFHLLRDRLDELNALRGFGIVTLGQFEHARELALDLPIEDAVANALDLRVSAARAWLERWKRGHVVPVSPGILDESSAISETFIEPVARLNQALGGDARALIDALRDGRVSRFRSDKTDQLESFLAAGGHLDDKRAPADAELIDTLARAGGLAAEDAARLHRWLQAALGTPSDE